MKTRQIIALLGCACALQSAHSQAELKLGNFDLSGSVTLGGQMTNGAERTSARFAEYSDIGRTTLLSNAQVFANSGSYYINLSANQVGLKDQAYSLSGGSYESFDYELFYDSIFHKLSLNALSPLNPESIGTGTINYPVTTATRPTFPTHWTTAYDYTKTIKTYGVNARYGKDSPFFATVGVNQVKTDGLRPFGAGRQTFFAEVPDPMQYTTLNAQATAGYRGDKFITQLTGDYSKFDSEFNTMTVRIAGRAATSTPEHFSLAPDNKTYRIGLKSVIYDMPLDSTLTLNAGYTKLTNEFDLPSIIGNTSGANYDLAAALNTTTFKGDHSYGSANVAYASRPISGLDTKLYYNFLRKWNQSTGIVQTVGANKFANDAFNYFKHNIGVDVGYKLPFDTKATAGFEYLKAHRHREDSEQTKDSIYKLGLKNSTFDFMTASLKFQYLNRTAEASAAYAASAAAATTADDEYLRRFVRFYDTGSKKQSKVSLGLDFEPIEHLGLGLEGAYQKSDYANDQLILGRTKDDSMGATADVTYEFAGLMTVGATANYERINLQARQFQADTDNDPAATATADQYTWLDDSKNDVWGYGLRINVPLMDKKLNIGLGWDTQRAHSRIAVTTNQPTPTLDNIDPIDTYQRDTLTAKTRYQITEALAATVGYIYEMQNYNDWAVDGYKYVVRRNTSDYYLAGAYADQNYKAHVGYVTAEYRF